MRKICTKCHTSKPATLEFFHKARYGKNGLCSRCKECVRSYYLRTGGLDRERRYKDRKRCSSCGIIKPRSGFHFSKKINGWLKGKCKQCRSEINYNPLSNRNTPLHVRKQRRLATKRKWYRRASIRNPETFRQYGIDRRARLRNAEGCHSEKGWIEKVIFYGWRCVYCGCKLNEKTVTRDHKIPLSKNGTNWLANLSPACHKCNSGKCDRRYGEYSPKWI